MLRNIRVVELSRGIAASYAGKQMVDAGAEVKLIERRSGHPLRRWSPQAGARPGLLFEYLAAGKESIYGQFDDEHVQQLLEEADLIIDDSSDAGSDFSDLFRRRPTLVVASITPYGRSGPWRGRPSTNGVLQAWSGSTGRRGMEGRQPVQAGNQICEWVVGMYAGGVSAVVLRGVAHGGPGGLIDISMLETAAIGLDAYSMVVRQFREDGADTRKLMPREPLAPAIEPTSDGLVGMMPNTARQWMDFFLMIERPDFAEENGLLQVDERIRRGHELRTAIRAWTEARTTQEVVDVATAFRIPAALIGNGRELQRFEQLVDRGVYVKNAEGHSQPRVPYQIRTTAADEGTPDRAFGVAPSAGAEQASFSAGGPTRARAGDSAGLPLSGLKVLDFSAFWAAPAMTHILACLGADVVKVESVQRPDGMRQATSRPSDPEWWEWGGIHQPINVNKRGITLDLTRPAGLEIAKRLVEWADVVVENFTPRVMEAFGLGWRDIQAVNPHTTMVRLPAFGLSGPWKDRAGFAMTIEQTSGLSYVTGYPDAAVPLDIGGVCDPIGGLHGLFALMIALADGDQDGQGRLVEVPLVEGALNFTAEQVMQFEVAGVLLERQGNRGADAVPQGVYLTGDTNTWVTIATATRDQWCALRDIVGGELRDPGLDSVGGRRARYDDVDAIIGSWCAAQRADEIVQLLNTAAVPVGVVGYPADIQQNEQMRARGFFEVVDHPVSGAHELPSMPFKLSTGPDRWCRTPAPTLGQHNIEVLTEIVGLNSSQIESLEADLIIGNRPV